MSLEDIAMTSIGKFYLKVWMNVVLHIVWTCPEEDHLLEKGDEQCN